FLSTDVHLWATYAGLLSAGEISANGETVGPTGVACVGEDVRIGRACWLPTDKNKLSQHISAEDKKSGLCWFLPEACNSAQDSIDRLTEQYFIHPAKKAGTAVPKNLTVIRDEAARIARCLLAPLLASHSWYRGPLLATPPEEWLVKLRSPSAHTTHTPH